jgi:hypothetical protein
MRRWRGHRSAGAGARSAGPVPGRRGGAGPGGSGSVLSQPAGGEIALRGSGEDIEGKEDGCYFLNQPLAGDFQITVRMLSKPTGDSAQAKAALMLRESLDPGARCFCLCITQAYGLKFQRRSIANEDTDSAGAIPPGTLKLPLLLRLTRRGNTVTPEYSRDNGQSFQPAGEPFRFEPSLAKTLYAGLAITSHHLGHISEAKFSGLEIRKQ